MVLTDGLKEADFPTLFAAQAQVDLRDKSRTEAPLVRLWDGDWNMRAVVGGEISGEAERVDNDTGPIALTLPRGHYLWEWLVQRRQESERKNTFITIDKNGVRFSGILDEIQFDNKENGEVELTAYFLDDIEQLKSIRIWSNPVLPAAIQFPRVFMLAGPSIWCLKTTIFLNLMRLQNSLFALPDDPLDFGQWIGNLDMRNWPIAIKGGAWHLDSSPHAIISSRFKTAHGMARDICDDAGLSITYRRYLPGDDDPWPGYRPRTGQLVFDIVDKNHLFGSTGTGGNILTGLIRTILHLVNDFMENDRRIARDPNADYNIEVPGTRAGWPWVVIRESEWGGAESSSYRWKPPREARITSGGHSLAGVNELISAAIQLAGDLASSTFIGPNVNLGQIADTFLQPLYVDTILAWHSFKMIGRAQELGWSYLHEYMPPDADRAYQLSHILAVRRAMIATGEKTSHSLKIADGAPYIVGESPYGDFFVGDRICSTIPGSPDGQLLVDKCSRAAFSWDRSGDGWDITVGQISGDEQGWDRIIRRINNVTSALHDQGVL